VSALSPLRVAVVQLNSGSDIDADLERCGELIARAAADGAGLVLLPENFAAMAADDAGQARIAAAEVRIVDFLRRLAHHHRLLLLGTLPGRADDGRLYNHTLAFGPDGKLLASYAKMHLFDVEVAGRAYRESAVVHPGEEPVHFDWQGWRIGLSICYDLRFPELFRRYAAVGCRVLTVPAAFTEATGRAHWEVLLRARAIENQCYLLAAGQWGEHPGGRRTYGHSMIVDPWGEVLATLDVGEGVAMAAISRESQDEMRRQMPVLGHRRL